MANQHSQPQPSPDLLFTTINAYQQTAALKAAIELDLFTAIGEGAGSTGAIAERCGTSERGSRILCDYLAVIGFLSKEGTRYELTPEAVMFLDRRSPAYMGGAIEFLLSPELLEAFKDIASAVRKGGTLLSGEGSVEPENPIWVQFARSMALLMALPAQLLAKLADGDGKRKMKILDIAAGHGLFGIAFAQNNRQAEIYALDWPKVLEVAGENAKAACVSDRYHLLPGSAFEVDYGNGYDLILLTNFLHHFDSSTCENLLLKVNAALNDGGRAVALEFVPNEDRVTPPAAATFSLTMLATTPGGDAHTFAELDKMFGNAGFSRSELHPLPPTMEQVVIAHK